MATLKEVIKALEFNLPSNSGKNVRLKDFRDKKRVILYFFIQEIIRRDVRLRHAASGII